MTYNYCTHSKCGLSPFVQFGGVLKKVALNRSGHILAIKEIRRKKLFQISLLFFVVRKKNVTKCEIWIDLGFHINIPWTECIYPGCLWTEPICQDLLCFTKSWCAPLPPNTSGAQELASGQHLQFTNTLENYCNREGNRIVYTFFPPTIV